MPSYTHRISNLYLFFHNTMALRWNHDAGEDNRVKKKRAFLRMWGWETKLSLSMYMLHESTHMRRHCKADTCGFL